MNKAHQQWMVETTMWKTVTNRSGVANSKEKLPGRETSASDWHHTEGDKRTYLQSKLTLIFGWKPLDLYTCIVCNCAHQIWFVKNASMQFYFVKAVKVQFNTRAWIITCNRKPIYRLLVEAIMWSVDDTLRGGILFVKTKTESGARPQVEQAEIKWL